MAFENSLLAKWRAGQPTLGLWCSTADPALSEYAATVAGADFLLWDLQHGQITDADLAPCFRALVGSDVAPLARVAANDFTLIGRALDAGAYGVVVPLVNTAEQATAAARACRYPPDGERSFGPNRAAIVMESLNPKKLAEVACIVMVETAEGLANVDAIASTPGVDAILVGPSDLAIGLGLAPDDRGAKHADAVKRVAGACRSAGIAAGIVLGDGATSKSHIALGFQFINVATDLGLIVSGFGRELAIARGG
jgi:4-hydroxy-2-oxoheptanedioate aldolase